MTNKEWLASLPAQEFCNELLNQEARCGFKLPAVIDWLEAEHNETANTKTLAVFARKDSGYPDRMEADRKIMNALVQEGVVQIGETPYNDGQIYRYTFDLEAFAAAPKGSTEDMNAGGKA